MKNLRFCIVAVILSAVIFVLGYSILRSGEGTALMLSTKISASINSDKIENSTLTPYVKTPVVLPDESIELTADILDSVVIDGVEYTFPIRVGDLSDDFSYTLISNKENRDKEGEYCGTLTLSYKNQHIATAWFINDRLGIDDDTVFETLWFLDETNKYIPQITVAGIDVFNADIREINRVYGYDSDEYGYNTFEKEDERGIYSLTVDADKNTIAYLRYWSERPASYVLYPNIVFYKTDSDSTSDSYIFTVPEDYSIETDEVNNAMEYVPIPDKNDELEELVSEISIKENKIKLPCTLNALMYALGENAQFSYEHNNGWEEEYGVFKIKGTVTFGEDSSISAEILLVPGKKVGESQVIGISYYGLKDETVSELIAQIEEDNPYGFKLDEKGEEYMLTDYKYNNVVIDGYRIEIYYWGENTEQN